jgi:putative flippase GtrA
VINTLVGLSVIFGLKAFLQANDVFANAIGYLVGLSVSFVLNRSWTFRHEGNIPAAAVRFLAVFLVAYTINLAVVLTLIHGVGVNSYLAQALGMPPYTLAFFLLSKFFAFRRWEAG